MGSQGVESEGLADRIIALYIKSHGFGNREFLPAGSYQDPAMLSPDVVREELELKEGEDEGLVNFTLTCAPKLFLICRNCCHTAEQTRQFLRHFRDNEFNDAKLPVSHDLCNSHPAFHLRAWKPALKRNFCNGQWDHLAPVFSEKNFIFRLEIDQPLPFLKPDGVFQKAPQGASSIVHRVKVHEDHLENPPLDFNGRRRNIAIKEIRVADSEYTEFQAQFNNEAKALMDIRDLKHPHIIQWLAAFTQGSGHYLMFPWADGGSLRDFWKEQQPLRMSLDGIRGLVWEALQQFRGLTDAFVKLHMEKYYRHGDVKPENILRFKDGKTVTGILQIADFGLAKQHNGPTVRRGPTATRHTTLQYESPEAEEAMRGDAALSRLSDIWSLGCVMFEYAVWLLYGNDEADRFGNELRVNNPYNTGTAPFYQRRAGGQAVLNLTVEKWHSHMRRDTEGSDDTAIGGLLSIIHNHMLTTGPLRTNWESTDHIRSGPVTLSPGTRASARDTLRLIDGVIQKARSEGGEYLFKGVGMTKGQPGRKAKGPSPAGIRTLEPAGRRFSSSTEVDGCKKLSTAASGEGSGSFPILFHRKIISGWPIMLIDGIVSLIQRMNPNWSFAIDTEIPARIGTDTMFPASLPPAAPLCAECKKLDFGIPGFSFTYQVQDVKVRSRTCGVCDVLWDLCVAHKKCEQTEVKFEKYHSTLKMDDDNTPILSMIRSPELKTVTPLQLGFPKLPKSGSESHFEVIRQWLNPSDQLTLPTRLIDVGSAGSSNVWVVETESTTIATHGRISPYIALSHPWGPPPHFCTFPDDPHNPHAANTLSRHKAGIEVSALPATFQDAVRATRALGKQYLWIDSLCILQGPKGDFKDEAKKMEAVFSSAYCVLSASCAANQQDGFLKTFPGQEKLLAKRDRRVVTVKVDANAAPLYLCEMIDNFDEHVLKGGLSQRAWVLQERALARRTVYFTERQTYWECGKGVRCETMTQMNNKLASFLGDPFFPSLALQGNRGERIHWYQSLYTQYSRLGLSHDEDRPTAIRGLESRLVTAFQKESPTFSGCYGVLDDGPTGGLLHRSLLWRRGTRKGDPRVLDRIVFPSGHDGAPSWSWMSYRGGIDFISVEGNTIDWEKITLEPRGKQTSEKDRDHFGYATPKTLVARARDFHTDVRPGESDQGGVSQLVFDSPGMTAGHSFKCVVVGREKGEPMGGDEGARVYFVLIVKPASINERGTGAVRNLKAYKRVGAGSIPGRCILGLGKEGEEVAVV
ncbi:mitogen-activated protein kinase [Podospora aff. communis PSN243]|uniref:Mitogen-activated protein kinase n=1 Tax=Podospora aff. communis PSN243 TaxID=3040156 RepID=A0AAV9GC47_9PEZI|nr:mitogen-activated protein kinase [Podospora aff. communis PSN243]